MAARPRPDRNRVVRQKDVTVYRDAGSETGRIRRRHGTIGRWLQPF
jgi:hypothetical protein